MKRYFIFFILLILITPSFAQETSKYPNYGNIWLGDDKFEKINRKVFNFNLGLNKYAIKPASILWSSIMPKYGIERMKYMYSNILYPKTLISTICQGDIKAAGKATARFVTNSTLGIGGMFDPAKRFLKLEPVNEDMEQVFAKMKIKQGPYLVVPILTSTTPRGLAGFAFDTALNPTSYIGSPVIAAVKAGFTLNNLTVSQKLIKTVSTGYIDPYEIARKAYGLKNAILDANLDRSEEIEKQSALHITKEEENFYKVSDNEQTPSLLSETIKGSATTDEVLYEDELIPDIILENFNSQHPVIDSMRTVLFEVEGVDKSMWGDLSVWNRSFQNKIKTSSVQITENREKFQYSYILQKDKNAPLAILFPSVGEGVNSHHSIHFAKLFYDEGYSVLMEPSAFHYSFYKSMDENYRPGIPENDAKQIRCATSKIINTLEGKYGCKFSNKVVLGTSFGAMSALFLGDLESKENILNISKFISINPPIELLYAINEIDLNSENFEKNNLENKTTLAAAKVLNALNMKDEGKTFETLPFDLDEAKLITGFVLHQKLSDLLYAIEGEKEPVKSDFYKKMENTNYKDYAKDYLISNEIKNFEELQKKSSLYALKDYLAKNSNYIIYHSLDDYLVNREQLKKLKTISKRKMRIIDKGAHLGFLYRSEFLNDLKKEISMKEKIGI